jgi:hypothetical protein
MATLKELSQELLEGEKALIKTMEDDGRVKQQVKPIEASFFSLSAGRPTGVSVEDHLFSWKDTSMTANYLAMSLGGPAGEFVDVDKQVVESIRSEFSQLYSKIGKDFDQKAGLFSDSGDKIFLRVSHDGGPTVAKRISGVKGTLNLNAVVDILFDRIAVEDVDVDADLLLKRSA